MIAEEKKTRDHKLIIEVGHPKITVAMEANRRHSGKTKEILDPRALET
jgi:hypothetical protein